MAEPAPTAELLSKDPAARHAALAVGEDDVADDGGDAMDVDETANGQGEEHGAAEDEGEDDLFAESSPL